ncbi:MAG: hypothetical protein ACW97Z_15100, partial [Candidatus Hodarchaeales archaeon]
MINNTLHLKHDLSKELQNDHTSTLSSSYRTPSPTLFSPSIPEEVNQWSFRPSIQAINTSTLLNQSIDEGSFEFIENIWAEDLGSGVYHSSDYEFGDVDPLITHSLGGNGSLNASLFSRIGNTGYGLDLNESLAEDLEKLSGGWRFSFSLTEDYEFINVSFWWRFDAMNGVLDDYRSTPYLEYLDPTPDYQEIRCKIIPSSDPDRSFWLGETTTPNETVFYRVGPNVTLDETWYYSSYLFYANKSLSTDFTLELGSFMNTREDRYEYFDVWFDDILVQGVTNVSDTFPPILASYGLARSEKNSTRYEFWSNFSLGIWESPISNVTVFYNLTRDSVTSFLNLSLVEISPFIVNYAGYNQTRWNYTTSFNFEDNVTYKFVVNDLANNSYTSLAKNVIIGDFVSPRITSSTNINSTSFLRQSGQGNLEIRVNVTDWGYGVDQTILNYTLDGIQKPPISMSELATFNVDGLTVKEFGLNLTVEYGNLLTFGFVLSDLVGNTDVSSYSDFNIITNHDILPPLISEFNIYPSSTLEEKTHVEVAASDIFGEISSVFLTIKKENEPDQTLSLRYDNESHYYIPRTPRGLLDFPYEPTNPEITLFVSVRDEAGLEDNQSSNYVVRDVVAPQILSGSIKTEYLYPGSLRIRVSVRDEGSGLSEVFLQLSKGSDWGDPKEMHQESDGVYYLDISTSLIGNQEISFRVQAVDQLGNVIIEEDTSMIPLFVTTTIGLFFTELLIVLTISAMFTSVKVLQRRKLRTVRRRRFDIALRGGERLAYLGEEAMFGFVAAYGQGEGISSTLLWEPSLIGHFYQYLKELVDRANNAVDFVMQTRAEDMVTYVDFTIEEISCSAIAFAYPVASLPQKWVSALSLEHTPETPKQGVLFMMLLMREKWSEVSHTFQDEITEGMQDIKNYILAGEDKGIISQKIKEFRLFISGT